MCIICTLHVVIYTRSLREKSGHGKPTVNLAKDQLFFYLFFLILWESREMRGKSQEQCKLSISSPVTELDKSGDEMS